MPRRQVENDQGRGKTVGRTLLVLMLDFPMVLVAMVFLVMFFALIHRRGAPRRVNVDRNKILHFCGVTAKLRAGPTAAANRGQGAIPIIPDEAELRAEASNQALTALSHGERFRVSVIHLPRYGSLEPLAQTLRQAASGRR
jgi:hypothetical protein